MLSNPIVFLIVALILLAVVVWVVTAYGPAILPSPGAGRPAFPFVAVIVILIVLLWLFWVAGHLGIG